VPAGRLLRADHGQGGGGARAPHLPARFRREAARSARNSLCTAASAPVPGLPVYLLLCSPYCWAQPGVRRCAGTVQPALLATRLQ